MNMGREVVELDLNDVLPNRFQPRIRFHEESINELAESIKEHGVIQPIVVRQIGDKYEIIAGERRYKASMLAGKATIPAIVTKLDDKDSAEVALIENVQRKDLTPIEEAISYKKILDMGYLTQEELANKLGKTQSTVANKLRLLNLNEDVQEALLNEQISERHARSLLRLNRDDLQKQLLNRIIDERLTVRRTDEEIDKMLNSNHVEFLSLDNDEKVDSVNPLSTPIPEVEELDVPTAPIVGDTVPEMDFSNNVSFGGVETLKPIEELNLDFNASNNLESTIGTSIPEPIPSYPEVPVVPVVEEVALNTSVTPEINGETNTLNPGFMNIDQIQNQAEDIYQPKPLADVDSLLEPSSIEQAPIVPETVVSETEEDESDDNILIPGKFFNIMKEETEVTPQNDIPTTDLFHFDANTSSFDIPVTPESASTVESVTPVVETEALKVEETPAYQPVYDFNEDLEAIVPGSVPILEGETTVSVAPVVEPVELMPASFGESVQTVAPTVDLKGVINLIRNCSNEIEKMGYQIDTEEFDFDDMYQVIFKINK